jgi:hypothetical protein
MDVLLLFLLLMSTPSIHAQVLEDDEDRKRVELGERIGVDYSMPDFSTSKIGVKVIGKRLAKMLKELEKGTENGVFNHLVSHVLAKQIESFLYVSVEKLKIV